MKKIFFDLDGTLIDSKKRLYVLFCDLTQQNKLSFDEYWDLKKAKVCHSSILKDYFGFSELLIKNFNDEWLGLIENSKYLDLDALFSYTEDVLRKLSKNHELFIVTARQDNEALTQQLRKLKIINYFKQILVTEAKKTKVELLQEYFNDLSTNDILVGDTGMDVSAARELGIISVAVLSGFRNREVLLNYNPDYIENDIQSIIDISNN